MYDFIIFEHSGIRNHFIDLCTIGKMLKDCGYNIAIANVTHETEECQDCGLPIVEVDTKIDSCKDNDAYMKAVFNELSLKTRYFYAGSILSSTRLTWLKYVPADKKVFLWALRSFFFTEHKRPRISRSWPSQCISSIYNTYVAKKYKNVCFFISEPIILDEFIQLGIEPWRMVIRQERTCKQLHPVKQIRTKQTNFLSIGALRTEKRVDLCMKAMDEIPGIKYVIAGKAYTTKGYDVLLDKMSSERDYVTRMPIRLTTEQYNSLIDECDYLVLSDEKQPSCVTNGTMAEALLAGRPIIAPNYDPYKYVIEKYGIGFLYEMHNHRSLVAALRKAVNTEPSVFAEGIRRYQQDLMYDHVIADFASELKESLNQ